MKISHILLLTMILGCTLSQNVLLSSSGDSSQNDNKVWNPFGSKNPFNFQSKLAGNSQFFGLNGLQNQQDQQNQRPVVSKPHVIQSIACQPKQKIVFPINQIKTKLSGVFEKSSKMLNELSVKLLKELDETYPFFGLSKYDKAYLAALGKGESIIYQPNSIKDPKQDQRLRLNKQITSKFEQKVQQNFNKFSKQIEQFANQIRSESQLIKADNENCDQRYDRLPREVLSTSKVLKTRQDVQKMSKFFEKPILKAQLCYRGSQNAFSAAAFHRKCDSVVDTLTIVQTTQDKIFGGYTPLKMPINYNYGKDQSFKSFLFQFNYNDKFTLMNSDHAIYNNPSYGPLFGVSNCDFYISDRKSVLQGQGILGLVTYLPSMILFSILINKIIVFYHFQQLLLKIKPFINVQIINIIKDIKLIYNYIGLNKKMSQQFNFYIYSFIDINQQTNSS